MQLFDIGSKALWQKKLFGRNLRYASAASEWNAKFVFVLRSMPSLPVAAEGERGVNVCLCVCARVGNGNDSKRVRSSRSYGYTKRDSVVDFRRHLKCRRRRRGRFTVDTRHWRP